MIYKAFVIFLLFITTNAYGEEIKKNHLQPEWSVFLGHEWMTDYYSKVVNVFSNAYEGNVKFRTIITPSFNPEYAIGVRQEGDKYFAFKFTAKKNIWITIQKNKETISSDLSQIKLGLHKSEVAISEQIYKIIEVSWQKMLQNTQYPKKIFGGLDGISYHFTGSNLRTGWAWSPEPESQTGYLVKLTELLGQLTESKKQKDLETKLLNIGTRLIDSLE